MEATELDEKSVRLRDYLANLRKPLVDAVTPMTGYLELPEEPELVQFDALVETVWRNVFPLVVYTEGADGALRTDTAFIVFDTNAPSTTIVTNALGTLPPSAVERARELCALHAATHWVTVFHHHVAPTQERGLAALKALFLTLEDAPAVTAALARLNVSVIMHGHTHIRVKHAVNGIHVFGAASTTLGDCLRSDGIAAFDIVRPKDGSVETFSLEEPIA